MGHIISYMWSVRTTKNKCPLCGKAIIWACHGETGYAYCSRGPKATVELVRGKLDIKFCYWEGKCRRRDNGDVEFIYEVEDLEKIRK